MSLPKEPKDCPLITALRGVDAVRHFSDRQWELVLRQSRASLTTAKLAHRLEAELTTGSVPAYAANHLNAASVFCRRQRSAVIWEVANLQKLFARIDMPLVLLKGAAYLVAGIDAANGRTFNDIDILVPAEKIIQAEQRLTWGGWFSDKLDPYDQKYYRKWMHEIPPMKNMKSGNVLDMHHGILPLTSRYKPDTAKLLAAVRSTSIPGVFVLAPEDMLIHSATHLFHEGELEHGLRDLDDIHQMLEQFGADEKGFWDKLVPRAMELDLLRPLYYALHYSRVIFATPIPQEVLVQAEQGKPKVLNKLMDGLFLRALMPDHLSCNTRLTSTARFLLYVRAHYLRMPLYLLLPHLVRKAWRNRRQTDTQEDAVAAQHPRRR